MKHRFACWTTITALFVVGLFLSGCATAPVTSEPAAPAGRIALYWENTTEAHPERAPWSDYVIALASKHLETFESAKDIAEICPRFKSLSRDGKLKAIGEFWVATAYYESSFNPKSAAVDVGTAGKRDTYSVGLFQVSVVDQDWAKGAKRYTYEELLTALPNIDLGYAIMVRQIQKTGEILLPNASKYRYWAVLLEGNKHSKITEIKARVMKYAPGCG